MTEETTTTETTETTPVATATTTAPAATTTPPTEQTVPLARLQSVIGERREVERQLQERDAALRAAQETIEQYKKIGQNGTTTAPASAVATTAPPSGERLTPEKLRELVNAQTAQNEFNKACNDSVLKGRELYKDFDATIEGLRKVSPFFDPQSGGPILPRPLVEAALETGNAEEVLYALGKDSATADRILNIASPTKLAIEIAKLSTKLEAEKAATAKTDDADEDDKADEGEETPPEPTVSRAPAPIRPAAGRGTRPAFSVYDTKNTSTADWIAQRDAELARKRAGARR